MTKIQLNRSGGFLGKKLQATLDVDLNELEVIEDLQNSAPKKKSRDRDSFHYSVTINDITLPIDIDLLKGKLKDIVLELQGRLKSSEL
jgi:hypothetical protein